MPSFWGGTPGGFQALFLALYTGIVILPPTFFFSNLNFCEVSGALVGNGSPVPHHTHWRFLTFAGVSPCHASGPGSSAESCSSWEPGQGWKGGRPLARHTSHICGVPGTKSFVDHLFWIRVSYVTKQLPRCDLLKFSPWHKGLWKRQKKTNKKP